MQLKPREARQGTGRGERVIKGKGTWGALKDLNEGQGAWQAREEGRGDQEWTRMSLQRQAVRGPAGSGTMGLSA